MSDIELDKVKSGYNLQKINSNFEKVEEVINEEVLHTEGGNNVMSQDLDMNSNRIYNLPKPLQDSEAARLADVKELSGIDGQFSFVQEELPTGSLLSGMRWFKPSTPTTFTYYVDPNGNGAWLQEPVQKGSVDSFKHNDLLERDSADVHPASSISTTGGSNVQAALDEKASTAEAKAGTNDSKKMTPLKTFESFGQFGIGKSGTNGNLDFDTVSSVRSGIYSIDSSVTLTPPSGQSNFEAYLITSTRVGLGSLAQQMQIYSPRAVPKLFIRTATSNVFSDWVEFINSEDLVFAQNISGAPILSNGNVPGASLNPPKTGTFKNVQTTDVPNNSYGIFTRI